MKKINQFDEVTTLNIPENIKTQLLHHLIEPFGDIESTKAFWDDIGTTLYLIERGDTDATLNNESDDDKYFLSLVTEYPEWVLRLNDSECCWLLAVTITTDEGGGVYVCAPMTSPTYPAVMLSAQAQS